MKRAIIGAIAGTAVAGAVVYQLYKHNKLGVVGDKIHDVSNKTMKNVKNIMAVGSNQIDYLKEKANYDMHKGKNKLQHMMGK